MHQHRHNDAQRKVSLAVLVTPPVVGELGIAVEITHEHTEDRVAGHSRDRAHKAGRKAVAVDILHVLERGKAERDHDGIDDRVELEIERRAAPRRAQKQELARLLRQARDDERLEEIAEVNIAHVQPLDDGAEDELDHDGGQTRERAEAQQLCQQRRRLFVRAVLAADVHHQHDGRQQRDECQGIDHAKNLLFQNGSCHGDPAQNSSQITSGIVAADRIVLMKIHLDANASERSYCRHSAVTSMAVGHAASSTGMPSRSPLTNGRSTAHVSSGHTSRRTAATA